MDAALLIGTGRENMALPAFHQGAHTMAGTQGEKLLLQQVIVLEAVIPPGGIQNPVANIDHVKHTPELFFAELNLHSVASFR